MASQSTNEHSEVYRKQDAFHEALSRYLNGDLFSNVERLCWFPMRRKHICSKYAESIVAKYRTLNNYSESGTVTGQPIKKRITPYNGKNASVLALRRYLSRHLSAELHSAYVHGSLATQEEVNYSDFDALLIFRDRIFESSARLAATCFHSIRSQTILWNWDPLQHHGFFVLTESDLQSYCGTYFPPVLFDFAKSIIPTRDGRLSLFVRPSHQEDIGAISRMLDSVERKLRNNQYPHNYYELKRLLSQVLLLPSLYLQSLGTPVFKRNSFNLARSDFTSEQWQAVAEVSDLRHHWDFRPSILCRFSPHHFLTTLFQKKLGQRISRPLRDRLTPDFYDRIVLFVLAVREKLGLLPVTSSEGEGDTNGR